MPTQVHSFRRLLMHHHSTQSSCNAWQIWLLHLGSRGQRSLTKSSEHMRWPYFVSWGQTKVVEDHFKRMRQREGSDTQHTSHAPSSYWAMARDMKAIELHKREHLCPPEQPDISESSAKIAKKLFYIVDHTMSVAGTDAITGDTAWPTFSPQTAPFGCKMRV